MDVEANGYSYIESQMVRSADLWDARTDSRFVPWDDTKKQKPVKATQV